MFEHLTLSQFPVSMGKGLVFDNLSCGPLYMAPEKPQLPQNDNRIAPERKNPNQIKAQGLKLQLLATPLAVCKLASVSSSVPKGGFVALTVTSTEVSLTCEEGQVPDNALKVEKGWRALQVVGQLDFSLVGILAGISGVLARANISVFVISTFDTDFVMVKQASVDAACEALRAGGYSISNNNQMTFRTLLGSEIVQGKQGNVEVSSLEGKHLLLYFSAHWCPPCRGFTPALVDWYKKNAAKNNFEIVFVSSDKDAAAFDEYYNVMPWLALPFRLRAEAEKLSMKFKVSGIPTLVVLAPNGQLITDKGRAKVYEDPNCESFPWASMSKL